MGNSWISVKDRLPKFNEIVLIYNCDNKLIWTGYRKNLMYGGPLETCQWRRITSKCCAELHKNEIVTHWMELTEPPIGRGMKWISVKDRLPDVDDDKLILIEGPRKYHQQIEIGYLSKFLTKKPKWRLSSKCCDSLEEKQKVTHWMELPEMPKEDK